MNWYLIPHAGWRAIFYIGGVAPLVCPSCCICPARVDQFLLVQRNDMKGVGGIVARFRSSFVRGDARVWTRTLAARINSAPVSRKAARLERYCCGFRFHGFPACYTVAVLWTPSLLKLNGISPANTAFVVSSMAWAAL